MCPSLDTIAVSGPVLWTTGSRVADRDKTHDTSWKNASYGTTWSRNLVRKAVFVEVNPATAQIDKKMNWTVQKGT